MSFKRILGRASASLCTRMQSGASGGLRTGPRHVGRTDRGPRKSLRSPQSIQSAVCSHVTKPTTRSV